MSIQERVKQIRKESGLSQEAFAASIGVTRANLSQIELGNQMPTLEIISSIVRIYGKSYSWLIDGKEILDKRVTPPDTEKRGNLKGNLKGNPISQGHSESYIKKVTAGKNPDETGKIIEHVIDTSGLRLVPMVDISAAAGEGYLNQEQLDEQQVLRLPSTMVKSGYHLCIRVKGPSMAPTFQDGGYLLIRLLDKNEWATVRNEYCYVIVDTEGKTYVKRLRNRFNAADGGFIVCTSDNPDKMSHPNFNLRSVEIQHIWWVSWYFTAKMPNIHDVYYNRLSRLEENFDEFSQQVKRKLDIK